MKRLTPQLALLVVAAIASSVLAQGKQDSSRRTLVHRDGRAQSVEIVEISSTSVVHRAEGEGWATHAIGDCVALVESAVSSREVRGGLLELTDGQRLPGSVVSDAAGGEDHFAWDHAWLGRVEVPLERISRVVLQPGTIIPGGGKSDVIVMANGDVVEGFVTALGNPLMIEVETGGVSSEIELPLDRVAAVAMVAPAKPSSGWRVWFRDGTVLDVSSLRVGDDRFLRMRWPLSPGAMPENRTMESVSAILFSQEGMMPLATLAPTSVSGPEYRYTVPPPRALDGDAPLRLSRLEYRGPLVAHYELPKGSMRLVCEALLPESSRAWGDVVLIFRCDDAEVGRFELNAANPSAAVNVPLPGAELTIELAEGRNGPIQDRIELRRAMILRTAE